MDALLQFDRDLFVHLNSDWTMPVLDWLMPILTDLHKNTIAVGVVLPIVIAAWIWTSRARAVKVIISLLVAASAADLISYRVLKAVAQRPRPEISAVETHMPVHMRVESASGTSFPSNHAANTTAEATVLWLALRRWSWIAILYAALIAYSRVYVGVHYPLDVIGGAAVGAACGWATWRGLRNWIARPGFARPRGP